MMSDELTKRDEAALSEMGVRLLPLLETMDHESLLKAGYREIPPAYLGELGMAFQHVPGMVTHFVDTVDTGRLLYDKTKGDLAASKNRPGTFKPIVKDRVSQKITEMPDFDPLSKAMMNVHTIFSVLAMATSQYFLTQINSKLESMADSLNDIQLSLELERVAKLDKAFASIREAIRCFNDSTMKNRYYEDMHRIRGECFESVSYYKNKCSVKIQGIAKATAKSDLKRTDKVMDELFNYATCYRAALLAYSITYYLEVILSETTNSKYILGARNDINKQYNEHASYAKSIQDIKRTIQSIKRNQSLGWAIKAVSYSTESKWGTALDCVGESLETIENELFDQKKRNLIKKADGLIRLSKDAAYQKSITDAFDDYYRSTNCRYLDVIRTKDKAYLKYLDVPPDEAAGREAAV